MAELLDETFEDTGEVSTGELFNDEYGQENDLSFSEDVLQDTADIVPTEESTEVSAAENNANETTVSEGFTESASLDVGGVEESYNEEIPVEVVPTPTPEPESSVQEETINQADIDELYLALTEFIADWDREGTLRQNINNKINLMEENQLDSSSLSDIEESLSGLDENENLILTAIVAVSENQKEIFNALKVQNSLMYVQVFSLLLVIGCMFAILVWLRLR